MKRIILLVMALLMNRWAAGQQLNCDLALEPLYPQDTLVIRETGDTFVLYLKLVNYGPDLLDTAEALYFHVTGLPSTQFLEILDTQYRRPYLDVNEHCISLFMTSLYQHELEQDEVVERCFYLVPNAIPGYFYTDPDGSNDTFCIKMVYKGTTTSAREQDPGEGISLYPIPAQQVLYIQLPDIPAATLTAAVYDMQGRPLLVSRDIHTSDGALQLDIRQLPPGLFLLELRDETGYLYRARFTKL